MIPNIEWMFSDIYSMLHNQNKIYMYATTVNHAVRIMQNELVEV